MPEAPEIRVLADQLNKRLEGATIHKLYTPLRYTWELTYNNNVEINSRVLGVESYGKELYIHLENDHQIYIHLMMAGRISFDVPRINIFGGFLTDDIGKIEVDNYLDGLKLSKMHSIIEYTEAGAEGNAEIKRIFINDKTVLMKVNHYHKSDFVPSKAPDIFHTSVKQLLEFMNKRKRKNVTGFLMDQNIIAGIGNYLKCDILYRCKIYPHLSIGELSEAQKINLAKTMIDIPRESYEKGGSCDYMVDGKYISPVYNNKNVNQDSLNDAIKREKTKDGRFTYWVPTVQT
uniref:Formamidopyrimidine-DNA glycosylase catalytic domain-containing protein n=1 Tax=viral metagenome TaxID=1070528 RepID=A0A6C0CM88_9ZZZZ